uniref:MULE transposase domain-containing protein n=1 Tax=Acrobeloides nanus TaxID=290746 RepID=A0A914EC05_9BILA
MAIIGAVKKVFPGAQIIGCLFHLYQNWRKQLRKSRHELNLDRDWRSLKALAYTPTEEVVAAYEVLIRSPDFDREFWAPFLGYLEVHYIGQYRFGIRGDGQFKRAMWNVYDRTIENGMRTNNSVEGFHMRINMFFEVTHPTLWKFIARLRKFEDIIYKELRSWENGQLPPKRKLWERVNHNKKIACDKFTDVVNGQMTRLDYLKLIGRTLVKPT